MGTYFVETETLYKTFLHTTLICRYTPEVLPEISRASGVKIVAGTAYYVDPLIPSAVKDMTVEQVPPCQSAPKRGSSTRTMQEAQTEK